MLKAISSILFFYCVLFFNVCLFAQAPGKKPNIVIIISDDHAYQSIGAYGAPYTLTPQIDKLANEGVVFTNACVGNSICGPSRATLLTGKFSHKNGFKDNQDHFDGSQDLFVKRLQAAGYQTAWIGKWHLETTPQGFNFWEILPGQGQYYNPDFLTMDGGKTKLIGYVSNLITDLSENWLSKRDTSKPFCLIVGHKATHRVWIPDLVDLGALDNTMFPLPENFYDRYENRYAAAHQDLNIAHTMRPGYDLKVFPDTGFGKFVYTGMNKMQREKFDEYYKPIEQDFIQRNLSGNALTEWKFQRYMHDYLSTAISLDRNIGRLVAYLDSCGLKDNTMVMYSSDQGFYLGEHGFFDKRFMYEESFKTPLVIRYPPLVQPGTANKELVENIDFAPTFLELAGVQIPEAIQGKSLLSLFNKNNKQPWRKQAYYHYYEWGEHSVIPHFGIKTKRYKLIRFYQVHDSWELYDLLHDKGENKNLYGKKGYLKIARNLKKQLWNTIMLYDDNEAAEIFHKEF
jgi:arylsulfatase A-like enzyme